MWFGANFEEQHCSARFFLQVISKTANGISWILLTTHSNLGKFSITRDLSQKL